MDVDWNTLLIKEDLTVKETMKKMDIGAEKILFVVDENNILLGVITDGNIRRYLLSDGGLNDGISGIFNSNPICFKEDTDRNEIKRVLIEEKIEVVPIIDENKRIINVLHWADVFEKDNGYVKSKINVPVVIMAGGRGERLDPFTKILPKPLIPIGDKPIVEIIMDKFSQQGVEEFYITLNYKGEMIKSYFSGIDKGYQITYIWEKDFFGTAGSLRLLPSSIEDSFIVSNCDISVNMDFADLLQFHQENKNVLTVVGSIRHYQIPYGVIHFEKDGKISKISEKPEFDFTINTGLYVLSKEVLRYIPENGDFDMTDLLQVLLDKEKPIGVYPVSQNSYIDIGQWTEYKNSIEKLKLLG